MASKSAKQKARRGGRQKGTTNHPVGYVRHIPARCRACKSTALVVVASNIRPPLEHSGEIDGNPYNLVRWRRLRCRDCGQMLVQRSYEYRLKPAMDR